MKEIGTETLPLGCVQRVFELLLRERVWPRDTIATLEALVDAASGSRDPRELTEAIRRKIVPPHLRRRQLPRLEPLVIAPEFEVELQSWLVEGGLGPRPEAALHLRSVAAQYLTRVPRERAALVCTAALRPALADFFERFGLRLDVFAYGELPPELELLPALVLDRPPVPAALAG